MAIDRPDVQPIGPRPPGGAGGSRGATIPPASPDPLLGTTVDGVRLVRRLGEGGFAVVYEGRQTAPDAVPPVGTRLVTASSDRTIRIWDTDHGTELLLLRGHDGAVTDVAVSDDGRELVSASADRTLRTWARSDDEIQESRRHAGIPGEGQGRPTAADLPACAVP